MYFITTKRMLEVCFSAHPNIQYRTTVKIVPFLVKRIQTKCTIKKKLWEIPYLKGSPLFLFIVL